MSDTAPLASTDAVDPDALAWLQRSHVFHGQPEAAAAFLRRARLVTAAPGDWLIEYTDPNPPFVLLKKGRAEVFTYLGGQPALLGIIGGQDHVGEEAVLAHARSPISVRALRPTAYYRLEGGDLLRLLAQYPEVARRLMLTAESHRRAREQRPPWLPAREWVLVFVYRHWWVLFWRWLMVAVVGLGLLGLLLTAATLTDFAGFGYLAGLALLATLGVGYWVWVEWRNDYYLVTTQRASSVNRIFPVHYSRHEVPISMINAAEVETGFWGRRFDFGDVIARTWAEPPLVFVTAPAPEVIGGVLNELVQRTRAEREHMEEQTIQNRLRERLGLPVEEEPEAPPEARPLARAPTGPVRRFVQKTYDLLFHARREQGGVITYYKHPIFLITRVAPPSVVVAVTWAFFFWHRFRGWTWPSPQALLTLVFLVNLVAFLAIVYQVWDWANDIYQLTDTQILDIKAIPFGPKQRKVAPLDKVVSVDFERPSFWAQVFNYGRVTIQTGPEEPLIFERVASPDQVQQDLFLRMEALRRRREEEEWLRQQERFIDWLAAYHGLVHTAQAPPAEEPSAPRLPPLAEEARPEEPGPSWEEALGFDYDPWVTPPGIHPEDEEEGDEDLWADEA